MKRFTKWQTVFYASSNFSSLGNLRVGVVIERQVESCGAKQITFFDRCGNDDVFGRSQRADSPAICSTAEEAFSYLQASSADLICPDIYSDANKRCFIDARNGTLQTVSRENHK